MNNNNLLKREKKGRSFLGKVVSNTMHKTLGVVVERKVKHPKYGKYVKKSTKYKIHDEDNKCKMGDIVTIAEVRPISKYKSWKLIDILGSKEK